MSCFMFLLSHTKTQHTFNTIQLYGCFALIFVVPGLFARQALLIEHIWKWLTPTKSTVENDEDIENANHSKYKDKFTTVDQWKVGQEGSNAGE